MIAYDLETTRIAAGTPELRYITAFGADFKISSRVEKPADLLALLEARLLIPEFKRARFVGWNANNFDVYFIAEAVLLSDAYIIRPYLTRSKSLRGLKIISKADSKLYWEFLDGLAMTGLGSTPLRKLSKFLEVYAPGYLKLQAPNWETEEFNALNPAHVEYAERDSEGLYHGLQAFEAIMLEHFNMPLQPTIGNAGIKIFQAHIPEDVTVWEPGYDALKIIRDFVMRGGFCWCVKKYDGPVWKYDINQAYAAAMRDCQLPAGMCVHTGKQIHPYATTGIYKIRAKNPRNTIPFYYRDELKQARFGVKEIEMTWLTTVELAQLKSEGWVIEVLDGYFWDDQFRMRDYVSKLEALRIGEGVSGGPNGAQGLIMKCIGNNSYGKTVEMLDGLEIVMANDCPEGFYQYQNDDDRLQNLWFKFGTPSLREYHQPQLGAFITAHVRMEVRRAALRAPDAWLYADTDCVMFSRAVDLPIDPKVYGKWKLEASGDRYMIITKKVYTDRNVEKPTEKRSIHAKGMNVGRLTDSDFQHWYDGAPPSQSQIQRQNFVKVMTGETMFRERRKVGQKRLTVP